MLECSFKPKINYAPPSIKVNQSPRGFDQTVDRMRWATADKDNKLKIAADVGKAKLTSECFTANGLTAVQPFQLTTDSRPAQRIKNLK